MPPGTEEAVAAGLARMHALRTIDPQVARALRAVVAGADAGRVSGADGGAGEGAAGPGAFPGPLNPVQFAAAHGLDTGALVDALLAGCKAGLFSMRWSLTCPWCGMYVSQMPRLAELEAEFWCALCDKRTRTVLDSAVEVSFALAEALRPPAPAALEVGRWLEAMRNPAATPSPGIARILREFTRFFAAGPDGEAFDPRPLRAGDHYRLVAVSHDRNCSLAPAPEQRGVRAVLGPDGFTIHDTPEPGVRFVNELGERALLAVLAIPREVYGTIQEIRPATFGPQLHGKELLCGQAWRDLFGGETLGAGIALDLGSIAILFTDLKGSTAMYDAVGDVRAFDLVSEHFKILLTAVQAGGGAVIKTIGDALMAAFPEPRAAVRAALAMGAGLAEFNARSGRPALRLKVGVHDGPCLVVSSNQRLDYFGQTVNIAARVQALAEGNELVLSDSVLRAAGVAELLQGRALRSAPAHLKGVGQEVTVHALPLTP